MIDRKKGRGLVVSLLIICFGFLVLGGARSGNLRKGSNSTGRAATRGEKADPAAKPESNRFLETGNVGLDFISWVIYDTPAHLEVSGNFLYVGCNAFVIVDVSDAENPEIKGQLRPLEEGRPGSLVVNGNYAFVAWQQHGLRVIEIGNPSAPSIASTFDPEPGYGFQEVRLSVPYLYTTAVSGWGAEEKNWLLVIQIPADPGNQPLSLVGSFDLADLGIGGANPVNDFMIGDGFAYLTSAERRTVGPARLHILDISTNPISPSFVSSTDIGEVDYTREKLPHLAMAKKDDDIFVTGPFTDYTYLKVVNVADPEMAEVTDSWTDFRIAKIAISGNYAYVTDDLSTLHIMQITDPGNPQEKGSARISMPDYYNKDFYVRVLGDRAYLNMWDFYAVSIMDVSNPSSPDETGQVEFGHCLTDVGVTGSRAYASVWDYLQFYVADISSPSSPEVIIRAEVKGYAWGIDVTEDYAFLAMGASTTGAADSGGLVIFDINNPATPLGRSPAWNPVTGNHDVQVYADPGETRAYVVVGRPMTGASNPDHLSVTPGLRIVDFSSATSPMELGSYHFPAPEGGGDPPQGMGVHKDGDYAYLAADEGGLFILNISQPATPALEYQWNPSSGRARSVFVRNDYAYVAYGDSLRILDVSIPAAPGEAAEITFSAPCNDVVVDGDYAFVVTSDALRIFNVSNPAQPIEVASQTGIFCTAPLRIDRQGDYVYVACDHGGMYTFQVRGLYHHTKIRDYNGDGTSDIGIFRETTGLWAIRELTRTYFGSLGDEPVPGDYSGSATTEIGIFRESTSLWAIREFSRNYFGTVSDGPIQGDYDGDGSWDIAIFRESSGLWAIRAVTRVYFGTVGDEPVPGNYGGGQADDIGIFRPPTGLWALRGLTRIYFGTGNDTAVPGNYDGNGNWEVGIFRESAGLWAIRGVTRIYFGESGDEPVPADYDGDRTDEIGIFRPSSGLWAVRGMTRVYFGGSGDIPVTR